jgi:hypothetical protein
MQHVAVAMIDRASRMLWDGRRGTIDGHPVTTRAFFLASTLDVEEVNSRVMFTRDEGHHTSGWLKNPEYERCWHLSLSVAGPLPRLDARVVADPNAGRLVGPDLKPLVGLPVQQPELDRDLEEAWVDAFFADDKRYVWRESAKSQVGREKAVWHYRVFADEQWVPLVPRGEVYSTEFTEAGWQSWSELHAAGGPVVESTVDPS